MTTRFKTAADFRKSLENRLKNMATEKGENLQRLRRKVDFDMWFDSKGHQNGLLHLPIYSIFKSVQLLSFSLLNIVFTYLYVFQATLLEFWRHENIRWTNLQHLGFRLEDEEKLFQSVTKKLRAGDVILFHDFSETTIAILPRVIDHIFKSGLKVVRLDELLNEKPYA